MKQCNHCKQLKDMSEYYKNKSKKDGLDGACKVCSSARRLKNKDEFLEYSKNYYQQNKEHILEKARQRYKVLYETISEQKKEYRKRNAKAISNQRKAAYEANKIDHLERQKIWRQNNRLTIYMRNVKRNSRSKQAIPKWLNSGHQFELACICTYAASLNSVGLHYHVDHIIPLQGDIVSGLHTPDNLQVITAEENLRKGNRYDQTTGLQERKRIQATT